VVQGVADVEAAGHVGRRHHDAEGLALFPDAFVAVDGEIARRFPFLVEGFFNFPGGVGLFFRLAHEKDTPCFFFSRILANLP